MKAVICSDLHIDKTEHLRNGSAEIYDARRKDTRSTFLKIIRKVRDSGAKFLLIAGDLYDCSCALPDCGDFIKDAFLSIPDTYIFISPGNNDPYRKGSIYEMTAWPDNVHIFRRGMEAVEVRTDNETVRIYGGAFSGSFTKEPLITPKKKISLDKKCINILLMHGSDDPDSRSNYIDPLLLSDAGFDYCALGHVHQYSGIKACGNTFYAYTGSPEEFGFMGESRTPGGILAGEIGKNLLNLTFEEISSRKHRSCSVNVSDMLSPERLINAIRTRYPYMDDLVRVTLTGSINPAVSKALDKVYEILKPDYFYLEMRDRTKAWEAKDFNLNKRLTKIINDIALEECIDGGAPERAVEALNHPDITHM